jgi:preprotein translocase subunit SecB
MNDSLAQGGSAPAAPQLNVLAQYIKDFSFENPNAPKSLEPRQQAPEIGIQVNVEAKQFSDVDFEVGLHIEGKAIENGFVLFQFELSFAGVFKVQNIPQQELHPVIMIECPRLLFPFARQIVADAVRNGGFPPLLLEPIDFVALYRQRLAEQQNGANPLSS